MLVNKNSKLANHIRPTQCIQAWTCGEAGLQECKASRRMGTKRAAVDVVNTTKLAAIEEKRSIEQQITFATLTFLSLEKAV